MTIFFKNYGSDPDPENCSGPVSIFLESGSSFKSEYRSGSRQIVNAG